MKYICKSFLISSIIFFVPLCQVWAHDYNEQGICTETGCTDPYEPPVLQEGWYLLSNAGNVEWFSALVNQGGNDVNLCGKMVADIDFTNVAHTPIGVGEGTKFNGKFDGQGHRILNLKLRTTSDLQGFFGGLRGGGTTVRNLILDKSCVINGKQRVGGIAAFAQTNRSRFRRIRHYRRLVGRQCWLACRELLQYRSPHGLGQQQTQYGPSWRLFCHTQPL